MDYQITDEGIKVFNKADFNPQHILECGQVFCYDKEGENYISYPQDKVATIVEFEKFYLIKTENVEYFVDYFDLKTDYSTIKQRLSKFSIMEKPISFGGGIRILNQDLLETLVSFIISANNNIKRIKVILNNIRKGLGREIEKDIYSFPTYQQLKTADEEFFKQAGAGYRAKYLVKVLNQITPHLLQEWKKLSTQELRSRLISLSGVGPKVADCVLLFGYHRGESFPVDTWIAKMYNAHFPPIENRNLMRENLIKTFGVDLSGYAQQYLFYLAKEKGEKF